MTRLPECPRDASQSWSRPAGGPCSRRPDLALDHDEIRMTNVEGMPKSEHQMKRQQVLSRCFGFRDSDLLRHWSFVIRISAGSSSRGPSGIKPVSKELVRFVPEVQNAKQ